VVTDSLSKSVQLNVIENSDCPSLIPKYQKHEPFLKDKEQFLPTIEKMLKVFSSMIQVRHYIN
jgi:hypothetical protein